MKHLILCLLSVVPCLLFSQGDGNIWYFGNRAGVNFNTGSPIALTDGLIDQEEGCATACSVDGNLLFYSDGMSVWNSIHLTMPNGTGLDGHNSGTNSAVAVRQPNNPDIFYLFTQGAHFGSLTVKYSIIDMTLNGGLGDVTSAKNVYLEADCAEKVLIVPHANGTDFWVVIRKVMSTNFYSYLLDETGLSSVPIVSPVGVILNDNLDAIGYMKYSPVNNILASANRYRNLELFRFDPSTGVLSDPQIIMHNIQDEDGHYGLEFSPNGRYLYTSTRSYPESWLFQYDLQVFEQDAIKSSRITIDELEFYGGALQLAPDGKIYLAVKSSSYLGVINLPDLDGLSCSFVEDGFYLDGKTSEIGLPTVAVGITSTTNSDGSGVVYGTGITPNNDGRNDLWYILNLNYLYPNNQVRIFNRWGRVVYETSGEYIPWDGTHNGKELPTGSYFFTIDFGDDEVENENGSVSIIR